jgi:hypothetical protein
MEKGEVDRFFSGEPPYFCLNREYGDHSSNMLFSAHVAPYLSKNESNKDIFFKALAAFIEEQPVEKFDLVMDLIYALSLLVSDDKRLDLDKHKRFFELTAAALNHFLSKFNHVSEHQLERLELSIRHYSSIGLTDILNVLKNFKEDFK